MQALGSGCNVALSQEVALQPKKLEKGHDKGVPGGLISWGPADGGGGAGAVRGKVVVLRPKECLPCPHRQTRPASHICEA